jgi:hypothetical protein
MCGGDDKCCLQEEYSCMNKPVYDGECPNYYNCQSREGDGVNGACNCLSYCKFDSRCCTTLPIDWKSSTAEKFDISSFSIGSVRDLAGPVPVAIP